VVFAKPLSFVTTAITRARTPRNRTHSELRALTRRPNIPSASAPKRPDAPSRATNVPHAPRFSPCCSRSPSPPDIGCDLTYQAAQRYLNQCPAVGPSRRPLRPTLEGPGALRAPTVTRRAPQGAPLKKGESRTRSGRGHGHGHGVGARRPKSGAAAKSSLPAPTPATRCARPLASRTAPRGDARPSAPLRLPARRLAGGR
jgi:hypothetical protein